jgi:hypothetical protein
MAERADTAEVMASQLILNKLTGLEQAIQGLMPLLVKIVNHLEAQATPPAPPVADYDQLYGPRPRPHGWYRIQRPHRGDPPAGEQ